MKIRIATIVLLQQLVLKNNGAIYENTEKK